MTECVSCGKEMHGKRAAHSNGRQCRDCREALGMCRSCYERQRRRAPAGEASEERRDVNALLEDYEFLRSAGVAREDCAARLRVTRGYLDKVLQRAGQVGDLRSDWVPRVKRGREREEARSWSDDRIMALKKAYEREICSGRVPTESQYAAKLEHDARWNARRRSAA